MAVGLVDVDIDPSRCRGMRRLHRRRLRSSGTSSPIFLFPSSSHRLLTPMCSCSRIQVDFASLANVPMCSCSRIQVCACDYLRCGRRLERGRRVGVLLTFAFMGGAWYVSFAFSPRRSLRHVSPSFVRVALRSLLSPTRSCPSARSRTGFPVLAFPFVRPSSLFVPIHTLTLLPLQIRSTRTHQAHDGGASPFALSSRS